MSRASRQEPRASGYYGYTLDVYTRRIPLGTTCRTRCQAAAVARAVRQNLGGSMTTPMFIGRQRVTRRGVLGAALAAGVSLPIGLARPGWAAAASRGPVQLTLPPSTGPYPVGTVSLHLVDRSRPDPVAGPGHYRELMASLWYPARDVGRYPPARWLPAAPMRALLTFAGFDA